MALLGLNLVIINLLPIPLTDGGRLILLGFEAIMRRPVPDRIANLINLIGLVFLVSLMLYVLGLDILRQLGRH